MKGRMDNKDSSTVSSIAILRGVFDRLLTWWTQQGLCLILKTSYMDSSIHGKQHTWTAAYMESSTHGKQHTWKAAYSESGIHGKQHTWKAAYIESSIHGKQPTLNAASYMESIIHGKHHTWKAAYINRIMNVRHYIWKSHLGSRRFLCRLLWILKIAIVLVKWNKPSYRKKFVMVTKSFWLIVFGDSY